MIPASEEYEHSPLKKRQAGILLHPTSLPGPWGNGDFGAEAYRFVDFLAEAGQHVWQLLPLGPTNGGSPYQCFSAHAGNPDLISIELLQEWGWLHGHVEPSEQKDALLRRALDGFRARAHEQEMDDFRAFVADNTRWLEDFALYSALKSHFDQKSWTDWPAAIRDRDRKAVDKAAKEHAEELNLVRFEQFVFFRQWSALKNYANGKGISIFGDMPIFVAHDSADVWAQRECFFLDQNGQPTVVAGVPPDYFSETGQRWGNPHYDWEWMESDRFDWWLHRMESQLKLFDLVRIDHFRGFEAYWEVPAHEETAINGRWVKAPGDALFARLRQRFDPLPVVAEDLGIITEEVDALRHKYALPGMKVLQFAFEGGAENPYLPHNYESNTVVYTGTHDNDTTVGWFEQLNDDHREYIMEYLGYPSEPIPWPLITAAYASVSALAVVPLQDVLELDSTHRMNVPGTEEGNWRWRFSWDMVPEELVPRLRRLAEIYGR